MLNNKILGVKLSVWIMLLILYLGLVLRMIIAYYSSPDAMGADLRGDLLHHRVAVNIVNGHGFVMNVGEPYSFNPPGYAYFLAGSYVLFGKTWFTIAFIQSSLSMLSVVCVYLIASKIYNRLSALISASFMSFYPYSVYHSSRVMDTTLFTFMMLVSVALVIYYWRTRNLKSWIFIGLVMGLACLVRTTMLAVCIGVFMWLIVVLGFSKGKKSLLACGLGIVCIVLPWTIRNFVVEREFIFIDAKGIPNAYMGNNELTLEYIDSGKSLDQLWQDSRFEREPKGLSGADERTWYMSQIVDFVRNNPMTYIKLLYKKLFLFWSPYINPNMSTVKGFGDIFSFSELGTKLSFEDFRRISYTISYSVLSLFAICGFVLSLGHISESRLLLLVLLLYTLVNVLVWTSTRLRIPLDSILAIFAGYGMLRTVFGKFYENIIRNSV